MRLRPGWATKVEPRSWLRLVLMFGASSVREALDEQVCSPQVRLRRLEGQVGDLLKGVKSHGMQMQGYVGQAQ
eukprot:14279972-Heterocapsa_arctica.AAC.1